MLYGTSAAFRACVFKIGLTANPTQRRQSYLKQNFKQFVIVHKVTRTDLLGMLEMLEAALIAEFHDHGRCCRSKQLGGESMRNKSFEPRFRLLCSYECFAERAHLRMSASDSSNPCVIAHRSLCTPAGKSQSLRCVGMLACMILSIMTC